jgi:hypothetical protein
MSPDGGGLLATALWTGLLRRAGANSRTYTSMNENVSAIAHIATPTNDVQSANVR